MPVSPIAAQLYTLREFTKTPPDIAATLKRVRKIGYESVQLSALGKIDAGELANSPNRTGQAGSLMSVDRGRPEVSAIRSNRRDQPVAT